MFSMLLIIQYIFTCITHVALWNRKRSYDILDHSTIVLYNKIQWSILASKLKKKKDFANSKCTFQWIIYFLPWLINSVHVYLWVFLDQWSFSKRNHFKEPNKPIHGRLTNSKKEQESCPTFRSRSTQWLPAYC
jgi:hypothetical protein